MVNHLSDSVSIVDVGTAPAARRAHAAGRRRAARHRLRRRRAATAPSSPPRTAARTAPATRSSPRPASAAPTSGCSTPPTSAPRSAARRSPSSTLFGDTPRALAVAPDGSTVYAAVFHSGNQTTTVTEGVVCDGGASAPAPCTVGPAVTMPGGLPAPNTNFQGTPRPETGLIVKFDPASGHWQDELGRNWNNARALHPARPRRLRASTPTPARRCRPPASRTSARSSSTWSSTRRAGRSTSRNTEAHNEVRFEGPGTFFGSTTGARPPARGAHHRPRRRDRRCRATSTSTSTTAAVPQPGRRQGEEPRDAARHGGDERRPDALRRRVRLEQGRRLRHRASSRTTPSCPTAADHIAVSGGGPTGLVLDEATQPALRPHALRQRASRHRHRDRDRDRAPVRSTTRSRRRSSNGRPFLYDARFTSSNGEASCASCHVFGDFDSLAWDLGNPDDVVLTNPNPFRLVDRLATRRTSTR